MDIKTISILGCGWFGMPFAEKLAKNGFDVKGSTTSFEKLASLKAKNIVPFLIDAAKGIYSNDFFKCDLLFINIPPRKAINEINIYPDQLRAIAQRAIENQVKQIVFISSTGIFEDGNFVVDENSIPASTTLAGQKLKLAEAVFTANENFTATIIRFGGLIGANRNLAKFFAGRNSIPNGLAPINLIHLDDCIGFCMAIIKHQAFGEIYHAVAPSHPSRSDFYTQLCQSSQLEKPLFLLEKNEWKLVESKRDGLVPYQFEIKDWLKWAKHAFKL